MYATVLQQIKDAKKDLEATYGEALVYIQMFVDGSVNEIDKESELWNIQILDLVEKLKS